MTRTMRRVIPLAVAAVLACQGAYAQGYYTRDPYAHHGAQPPLASPDVADDAVVSDFIKTAEDAIGEYRYDVAQDAIEKAQTRILSRSTRLFHTHTPDHRPIVEVLSQALSQLKARDYRDCEISLNNAYQAARDEEAEMHHRADRRQYLDDGEYDRDDR